MLPTPTFCGSHPLDKIHFLPQARSNLGDLTDLIASIKEHGILQPPSVMETNDGFIVICGHRRIVAGRGAGLTETALMIYPPLPAVQVKLLQLTENIQRSDMTDQDIYRECAALLKGGLQRIEIGKALGKSPSTITRYLSPGECPPEAKKAFESGDLDLGQMDVIRVSEDPLETMRLLRGGTPIKEAIKRTRSAPAQVPAEEKDTKDGSVKIELPGGSILLKGADLSLARIVALLDEAHGEADRSHKLKQTVRTFVNVMRDRAKRPPEVRKKSAKAEVVTPE